MSANIKLCCKCKTAPRRKHNGYCQECDRAYQREYRNLFRQRYVKAHKVILPNWFNPGVLTIATTDKVTTYLCSAEPCYFVVAKNYEGYFKISDLKEVKND